MSEYKMEIRHEDFSGASGECDITQAWYGDDAGWAGERGGMAKGIAAARNAYPRNVLAFLSECGIADDNLADAHDTIAKALEVQGVAEEMHADVERLEKERGYWKVQAEDARAATRVGNSGGVPVASYKIVTQDEVNACSGMEMQVATIPIVAFLSRLGVTVWSLREAKDVISDHLTALADGVTVDAAIARHLCQLFNCETSGLVEAVKRDRSAMAGGEVAEMSVTDSIRKDAQLSAWRQAWDDSEQTRRGQAQLIISLKGALAASEARR